MALPLGRWPCGSHSLRTACATSSGVISRFWPAESSIAVSPSAGVLPVFATTRATDSFVISVSTNPGQTALHVTFVPSSSAATLLVKPITACFAAATLSIRSVCRAATTMAAPSAARAFAIAAPMPWPPPVTTATAPSKRRNHRLLEDRAQRFDQPGPLVGTGRRGIAKVVARAARLLERPLADADGVGQRPGVGG